MPHPVKTGTFWNLKRTSCSSSPSRLSMVLSVRMPSTSASRSIVLSAALRQSSEPRSAPWRFLCCRMITDASRGCGPDDHLGDHSAAVLRLRRLLPRLLPVDMARRLGSPTWLADVAKIFPVSHLAAALVAADNPHTTD